MKFSTAIIGSALATAAFAAPLTAKRQARSEARLARRTAQRHSNPPIKAGTTNEVLHFNKTSHEEYSSNWAGAVLIGTGYDYVTGEFTVPTPSVPSSSGSGGGGGSWGWFGDKEGAKSRRQFSDEEYCASAWVGIDGDTCETAILQVGVDFCVQGSEVSYDAWYEWYPDYSYDFDNIDISAGDKIKVTVDATSATGGTATVDNITTGKTVTHTFSNVDDGSLCEYNAEWIVEDFESDGELVPFADFGTVTFSSAEAKSGSTSYGPSSATLMDIEQDNEVLTSSSVSRDSVTVTYE
ncbi:hypothetical protein N7495_003090 [Penicillium taxi]|uniref:uncharacterized protein n=1 Tax=Penicillium taxi TaxID=168475 RepID=UPI0025451423|nr:uncharacterized protein N7495_003090 [Penicillium taxi]KAJ5902562.1 hypothetical protein N7495_003090 [Penicillium taxi]